MSTLYSSEAFPATSNTNFKSLCLQRTFTTPSINFIKPYSNLISEAVIYKYYLNDEVLEEFFVLIDVFGLFSDNLNLGLLVEFLNEAVDGGHSLDADLVVFGTDLDLVLDLVLVQLGLEVIDDPLLLILDVLLLLLRVLLFSLLIEGYGLLIALLGNELQHLLVVLFRLVCVHCLRRSFSLLKI